MNSQMNSPAISKSIALTPLKVTLLCHIHAIAEPIKNIDAPAYVAALAEFKLFGLIKEDFVSLAGYELTEFGYNYLSLILSTPLPAIQSRYIDPRTGKIIGDM